MRNSNNNYNIKNFLKKDIIEIVRKKEFIKWSKFEKKKYDQYLNKLYPVFNKFHKVNYSKGFWDLLLGYFLLIHISLCLRFHFSKFKKKTRVNQIAKKQIEILDPKYYYIPTTRIEHREYFQMSDLGQNQLFSQYIIGQDILKNITFFKKKKKTKNFKTEGIKEYIFKFRQYLSFRLKNPIAIFTGCYMSKNFMESLKLKNKNNLSFIKFYIPEKRNTKLFWSVRNMISNLRTADKFDKFFFSTLNYSLPRSILEDFNYNSNFTLKFLNKLKKLKFLFNENMTEANLFLVAFSKIKKIKTIYLEHNWIQHQYIGNIINFIKDKFDFFFTNGWKFNDKKMIPSGSYFFYPKIKKLNILKKKKILFVSGATLKRPPYTFSGHDAHDANNHEEFIKMNNFFFNNLDNKILKNIWIRRHPEKKNKHPAIDEFFYTKAKKINFINTKKESLIDNITSFELVVINYLSTPYLQTLCQNVPTVIFFNKNANFLNNNNLDFYNDLFNSNILHSDPKKAAKFVKKIWQNPSEWWNNKDTQKLKKKFLDKTLKDGIYLENRINNLINKTTY
jgi:putative transferase (TIGR04331 family)|tara:strand:- start:3402 stop:5084 length:1683 start_codon:yes stop_codon:yes gene_type:complete